MLIQLVFFSDTDTITALTWQTRYMYKELFIQFDLKKIQLLAFKKLFLLSMV